MINYIKAELYRNFNRIYFWGMTIVVSAFALLGNVLMKTGSAYPFKFENLFEIGTQMFTLPVFLVAMIIEMVTAEEQKNRTLKNVVSFGISRNQLVLSKFVVTIILSIISAIIILAIFFGSGAILFKTGNNFSFNIVSDFIIRLLSEVPLWIGAISIGTLLAFIFRNNTTFAVVYAGLFLFLPGIVEMLSMVVSNKFKYINNVLLTTHIQSIGNGMLTSHNIITAVLLGIVYTIICIIGSIICFNKMEVK